MSHSAPADAMSEAPLRGTLGGPRGVQPAPQLRVSSAASTWNGAPAGVKAFPATNIIPADSAAALPQPTCCGFVPAGTHDGRIVHVDGEAASIAMR